MKKVLFLLCILFLVGILLLGSDFWNFSREDYVSEDHIRDSIYSQRTIDVKFLREEFAPAYEF